MREYPRSQGPISGEEVDRRISEAGTGTRIAVQEVGRRTAEVGAGTRTPVRGVGRHTVEVEADRTIPVQVVDSRHQALEECSTSWGKGTYALSAALERSNRT
jgi:hypothetical protein